MDRAVADGLLSSGQMSDRSVHVLRWWAVRLALVPVVLLVVSAAVHFILFGPLSADVTGGCPVRTPEQCEALREELGIDGSWVAQYGRWIADAIQGDFGTSWFSGRDVSYSAPERLFMSAEFIVITLGVALASGWLIARLADRWPTTGLVTGRMLVAIPYFAALILALILPVQWWGIVVPGDLGVVTLPWDDPVGNVRQIGVQAVIAGLILGGLVAAIVGRSVDGAQTARRFRLALILALPFALSASIVAEELFAIPGAGVAVLRPGIFLGDLPTVMFFGTIALCTAALAWLFLYDGQFDVSVARTAAPPHAVFAAAAAVVAIYVFAAIFSDLLLPYETRELIGTKNENPSWEHWFGTNRSGQDNFTMVASAARPAFQFAGKILFFGWLPGIALGWIAGRRSPSVARVTSAGLSWIAVVPAFIVGLLFAAGGTELDVLPLHPVTQGLTLLACLAGFWFGASLVENAVAGSAASSHIAAASLGLAAFAIALQSLYWFLQAEVGIVEVWGGHVNLARQDFPLHWWSFAPPMVALFLLTLALLLVADGVEGYARVPAPSPEPQADPVPPSVVSSNAPVTT